MMNMNAVSDAILAALTELHTRTYRNKSPQSPTYPIIVYRLDTTIAADPSIDISLIINIMDNPNESSRTIEDLADDIQNSLDDAVIKNALVNLHFALDNRQYAPNEDLIVTQMVNLQFTVRSYFL